MELCDDTAHGPMEECGSHPDEETCLESGDHDKVPEALWQITVRNKKSNHAGTTHHCGKHAEEMEDLLTNEGVKFTKKYIGPPATDDKPDICPKCGPVEGYSHNSGTEAKEEGYDPEHAPLFCPYCRTATGSTIDMSDIVDEEDDEDDGDDGSN